MQSYLIQPILHFRQVCVKVGSLFMLGVAGVDYQKEHAEWLQVSQATTTSTLADVNHTCST